MNKREQADMFSSCHVFELTRFQAEKEQGKDSQVSTCETFFQLTSSGIVNPLFKLETSAPLEKVSVSSIMNRVKY